MKKIFTLLVAICATTALWAKKEKIDGVYYFLYDSDHSATVTYTGDYYTSKNTYSGDIVIPDTVTYQSQTYRVDRIGQYAFYNCSYLNSVTIPKTVTSIGDNAFSETYLDSIIVDTANAHYSSQDGVLFNYAKNELLQYPIGNTRKSYTIPNSVITIESSAFYRCFSLTSVTIPNSVTSIANSTFRDCSSLTSITIGNSVTSIGSYAFGGCSSLQSITIPDSLRSIESYAFYNCSSLSSANIGNTLIRYIGQYAFCGCTSLDSVTIPNSVYRIYDGAFSSCKSLSSITIPNSVTTIGDEVFYNCTSLTSITVDTANTRYCSQDGVLFNHAKDELLQYPIGNTRKSYTFPNSVKKIEDNAFYGCKNLTSITLPNSVTSIGANNSVSDTVYVVIPPFEDKEINSTIQKAFSGATLLKTPQGVTTSCTSPTCATIVVDLTDVETSQYAKMSLDYGEVEYPLQAGVNTIFVTGLKPNTIDTLGFYSQLPGSTEWRDGCKLYIKTPKLELTTLDPKVPASGEAIVCATTNIADAETKAGFEWRKYDAPVELPSSSAYAYVFNGSLQGKIKNLSNNYYKVRAFYEAADETRYYGDWKTFDPTEFSYFDPEVHTYFLPISPTSKNVTVRGLVTAGTDAIIEQGFEYWQTNASTVSRRVMKDVMVVHAAGQFMTATLDSLAYSTSYECRAFAKTASTTIYGEQISFITPEDPRPIYTLTLTATQGGSVQAEPEGIYREGDQVTVTATAEEGYTFVRWSDMDYTNPRTLTLTSNLSLQAIFEGIVPLIEQLENTSFNCSKFINNEQLYIMRDGKIYNTQGVMIK